MTRMLELRGREMTSGLQFPEGPVAMPDGSVVLVEIARRTLTRVHPDGRKTAIAELGGGPKTGKPEEKDKSHGGQVAHGRGIAGSGK